MLFGIPLVLIIRAVVALALRLLARRGVQAIQAETVKDLERIAGDRPMPPPTKPSSTY